MTKKSQGILFDYNGVIVDDEKIQEKAMANVVRGYGLEVTSQMYEKICLGRSDKEGFEAMQRISKEVAQIPVRQLMQEKAQEYERCVQEESVIYPGFKETLNELLQEFEIGVVTASQRAEIETVLSKEGILNLFKTVITADDVINAKPDPEGYKKGINALGLPSENIVVVEDTSYGVSAAKSAGLTCVAVLHTMPADRLGQADKIVKSVNEVTVEMVREILKKKSYE